MTARQPWLGIKTRDWFINSDTPHSLASRVRQHAHEAGVTLSAVVARALSEFLQRGRRQRRRR